MCVPVWNSHGRTIAGFHGFPDSRKRNPVFVFLSTMLLQAPLFLAGRHLNALQHRRVFDVLRRYRSRDTRKRRDNDFVTVMPRLNVRLLRILRPHVSTNDLVAMFYIDSSFRWCCVSLVQRSTRQKLGNFVGVEREFPKFCNTI